MPSTQILTNTADPVISDPGYTSESPGNTIREFTNVSVLASLTVMIIVAIFVQTNFLTPYIKTKGYKIVYKNPTIFLLSLMMISQILQVITYMIVQTASTCTVTIVASTLSRIFFGILMASQLRLLYIRTPDILMPPLLKYVAFVLIVILTILCGLNTTLPAFGLLCTVDNRDDSFAKNFGTIITLGIGIIGVICDALYTTLFVSYFVKRILNKLHDKTSATLVTSLIAYDGIKITVSTFAAAIFQFLSLKGGAWNLFNIGFNGMFFWIIYLWMNMKRKLDDLADEN